MSYSSITAVISHFDQGSPLRRRNIGECLKNLREMEVPTIVGTNTPDLIKKIYPEAEVVKEKQHADLFCKSKSYNTCIQSVITPYTLFLDADFKVDIETLSKGEMQLSRGSNLVLPYSNVHYMTKEDTEYFLENGVDPNLHKGMDSVPVGGIVMANTEFYKQHPMDEDFLGWGFEDFELVLRYCRDNHGFVSLPGVQPHMYHEHGKGNDVVTVINIVALILKIYFGLGKISDMGRFRFNVRDLILSGSDRANVAKDKVMQSSGGFIAALAKGNHWLGCNRSFYELVDLPAFRELIARMDISTRDFDMHRYTAKKVAEVQKIPPRFSMGGWTR